MNRRAKRIVNFIMQPAPMFGLKRWKSPTAWREFIVSVAALYLGSMFAGVAAIVLLTFEWETIGVGMICSLFALPALAAWAFARCSALRPHVCHAVFWLLLLPLPVWFLSTAFFPFEGARSDGADQLARYLALTMLPAGVVPYLWAIRTGRTKHEDRKKV